MFKVRFIHKEQDSAIFAIHSSGFPCYLQGGGGKGERGGGGGVGGGEEEEGGCNEANDGLAQCYFLVMRIFRKDTRSSIFSYEWRETKKLENSGFF